MVTVEEEDKISYAKNSPFNDDNHPERAKIVGLVAEETQTQETE